MSKPRYLVTHVPHYIAGHLVSPGMGEASIVTLPDGVKPGRWLVLVEGEALAAAPAAGQNSPLFSSRHVGGGNWVVERVADGARVASFGKTDGDAKALAAAEADRLNAGGEVIPVSTDAAPSSGQDDPAAGASGSELPDA
jgi:hypothetical protein